MTAPAYLATIRCHYCQRFHQHREILRLTGGPVMCWKCWQWHEHALKLLSGAIPPGCQVCGLTFADLEARSADGNTRMYVHMKDGLYQVLCRMCSDAYTVKRRDLYGATEFGHRLKL